MSQATQNAMLLAHFKRGERITGLQALVQYGVSHLPRRILDLKEAGHDLQSEWVIVTKANGDQTRVKEWRLA